MNADVFLFQETGINSCCPRMKNLMKKVIKHKIKRVSIHLNSCSGYQKTKYQPGGLCTIFKKGICNISQQIELDKNG